MRWYRLAADQGFAPMRSHNLGGMYGITWAAASRKMTRRLLRWYRLAADQGFAQDAAR